MNRIVLAIIMFGYLLSPYIYTWVADPNGAWYRPFIAWGVTILVLSIMSRRINSES